MSSSYNFKSEVKNDLPVSHDKQIGNKGQETFVFLQN